MQRRRIVRALKPREHALWGWVGVPLLAAVLLAPTWASLLGALAVLAGSLAGNALGKALRTPDDTDARLAVGVAGLVALGFTALALAVAWEPVAWIAPPLLALPLLAVVMIRGGRTPRSRAFEVLGIACLAGVGAAVAVAGGAVPVEALLVQAVIVVWLLEGLWWISGQLARVLPRRRPWREGGPVTVAAAGSTFVAAASLGHPLLGLVPLAYGLRTAAHEPARKAVDARRLGLTELAWAMGAAVVAVGVVVTGA